MCQKIVRSSQPCLTNFEGGKNGSRPVWVWGERSGFLVFQAGLGCACGSGQRKEIQTVSQSCGDCVISPSVAAVRLAVSPCHYWLLRRRRPCQSVAGPPPRGPPWRPSTVVFSHHCWLLRRRRHCQSVAGPPPHGPPWRPRAVVFPHHCWLLRHQRPCQQAAVPPLVTLHGGQVQWCLPIIFGY